MRKFTICTYKNDFNVKSFNMMMRLGYLFILFFNVASFASTTRIEFAQINKVCQVRVVTELPSKDHVGDVLFLTGFADRADNHKPLFSLLASKGYRVISFDYPSHGETRCLSLDLHSFTTLSNLAIEVLSLPQFHSSKPLYLSGWSTGGLLSYRMAQKKLITKRKVAGLVLLAPGFSVYPLPGENGIVTQESLLSNPNPPHLGPIKPTSPLFFLGFSSKLITNSLMARNQEVPNVPILMILGDDDLDVYANSPKIKEWYLDIKRSSFQAFQCHGAKHELDNEIEPIGTTVRGLFLAFVMNPKFSQNDLGSCEKLY